MKPRANIISCFFNHTKSNVLVENLKAFHESLGKYKDILKIIECVPLGGQSELGGVGSVLTVHSNSVLWQKERLLNIALDRLDSSVDTVIWCDTDLEFENPDWVSVVCEALGDADVLQPFASVVQKPALGEPALPSFSTCVVKNPELADQRFHAHGHTGYAWAIKREVIEKAGFFDECIMGGADHVMAHAFTGTPKSDCIAPLLGENSALNRRFVQWAARLLDGRDKLKLGSISQTVHHRRHGSQQGRMYIGRNRLMDQIGFDPERHLKRNLWNCWEWTESAQAQRQLATEYFDQRQEDQTTVT